MDIKQVTFKAYLQVSAPSSYRSSMAGNWKSSKCKFHNTFAMCFSLNFAFIISGLTSVYTRDGETPYHKPLSPEPVTVNRQCGDVFGVGSLPKFFSLK